MTIYYIRTLDKQVLNSKELIAIYGCRKDLKGLLAVCLIASDAGSIAAKKLII